MTRFRFLALPFALLPGLSVVGHAQAFSSDCSLKFTGSFRKAIKNRAKDNDFHLEISDQPQWESRHVIVEIPPGQEYCAGGQKIFDPVKRAGCGSDKCIIETPVKIRVTGYVFLDGAHGKTCKIKRGMINQGVSGAEGAWEIHPVLSVEVINQ